MPPRYAYWTILVDDQPTAFRSGSQEDLMPTFKRLQSKHASAKMMWWQNGKLWNSRLDAQEAMLARGEIGRSRDFRQGPGLSERRPSATDGRRESKASRYSDRAPRASERREERTASGKLDWKPKGEAGPPAERRTKKPEWTPKSPRSEKPEWKPKGSFTPERSGKPEWKPPSRESRPRRSEWAPKSAEKPEWKPKGSFTPERSAKADWKPKTSRSEKPEWKPKSDWKPRGAGAAKRPWTPKSPAFAKASTGKNDSRPRAEGKLEWKPKGEGVARSRIPDPGAPEKRKWVPKEEYKKSLGIEAKRDKKWRPGGEHKDPRQKYKDAKKAKWGRFKQTIRKRWESKPGGKKKDE